MAIENLINRVMDTQTIEPTEEGISLVKQVGAADIHCDATLFGKRLTQDNHIGHVDFHRLKQGGYKLQVMAAATKLPLGFNHTKTKDSFIDVLSLIYPFVFPRMAFKSPFKRALEHASYIAEEIEKSSGMAYFFHEEGDKDDGVGIVLALEGAHAIPQINDLIELRKVGFRVLGLSHFHDTKYSGSAHGISKGGLSIQGRDLVSLAQEQGFIIDLAHASEQTIADMRDYQCPLICSHTGLNSHFQSDRNISDESAKIVADTGGLIGIGFWEDAVGSPSIPAIASAISHAINIAGENHVALGSDFDGGIKTVADTSTMSYLIASELLKSHSLGTVEKVMSSNALRYFSDRLGS